MGTTSSAKPAAQYGQPNTVISISRPIEIRHVIFTNAAGQQFAMDVAYYGRDPKTGKPQARIIETYEEANSRLAAPAHVVAALDAAIRGDEEGTEPTPQTSDEVGNTEVG